MENEKLVYLPIKRIFLDQIITGQKKIEYRLNKGRNKLLLTKNYTHVVFHYYTDRKVKRKIKKVELKAPPENLTLLKDVTEDLIHIHLEETEEYINITDY